MIPCPSTVHEAHHRVDAGAGEGDERALVDLGVGERDEPLVERAVVPRQATARQGGGEHVEDRLDALGDRLVGADRGGVAVGDGGEERGRRQLAGVAGDDDLAGPRDRRHGLGRRHLRGLVEHDDVEPLPRRQHRRDDERAHHPARPHRGDEVGAARHEVAQRRQPAGPRTLGPQVGLLLGVLAHDVGHPVGDRARAPARRWPPTTARSASANSPTLRVSARPSCAATLGSRSAISSDSDDHQTHSTSEVTSSAGTAAGAQVVDERPQAGCREPVERRGHRGHHAEPARRGGERVDPGAQRGEVEVEEARHGIRLGRGPGGVGAGQVVVEPGQVGDQGGVGGAGAVELDRDLRAAAGAGELAPGDPLLAGGGEGLVQVGRRAPGAQQGAGLPAQPPAVEPAELGRRPSAGRPSCRWR